MGEHRVIDWLGRTEHPLLIVLAIGILLRVLLVPLSTNYDTNSWAENIRSLQAGFGLYGLEGYYYTPVWGYVLGMLGAFDQLLLGLGETSLTSEVLYSMGTEYLNSVVIQSPAFLLLIKVPLYVCDFITAYLVMRLVQEHTGRQGDAVLAFALTFLAPTLLVSAGLISMPDTISAMFAVLTVYLLKRSHWLITGMTFSLAFLTKFFPVFMIFVMVAYILTVNRDDRRRQMSGVVQAAVGFALMSLVIFLPQILDGNLEACFQFITDRTGTSGDTSLSTPVTGFLRILFYALVAVASAVLGYLAYKKPGSDSFETLMRGCLIVAALVLIYPANTQYMVILVPFLAYWIAIRGVKLLSAWKVLAVGATFSVLSSNVQIVLPLAAWTNLIDVDAVLNATAWWCEPLFFGFVAARDLANAFASVLYCLSAVMVVWHFYGDRIVAAVRHRRIPRGPSETEPLK